MRLFIIAKALAALAPRHKSRSGINKRLPALPKPTISSPENFVHISGFYLNNAGFRSESEQQYPDDESVQVAASSHSLASPRPSRMPPPLPPAPPHNMKDLPAIGGPVSPPNALSHASQSHRGEQNDAPHFHIGKEHEGHDIEGSMSSCTSEAAVAASAESGPDVPPSVLGAAGREGEVDLIDLHSRLSPVPEGEPDEARSAAPSLSAPPNATTTQVTLESSWEDPNLSDRQPEEVQSTSVAPLVARLTDEDRAALTSYLAEADDDRDHNEFLATLPLACDSDLNPLLAVNGQRAIVRAESGLTDMTCDRLSTSSGELGAIKEKESSLPKAPKSTLGKLESPLRLSTSSAITGDGTLHFVFGAGDEAQSKSIEEALAAFEASLAQNMAVQHLYLVLTPGVSLPANLLGRAIEKAHVSLTRFTRLTVHLQTTAAQAQAPWAWPMSSRLIVVQLNGIARGAILPWAQLQVLRISAAVKAVETAAFLVNLPQLRALSLCLGYVGSTKTKFRRSQLPKLEKLELESKIDPAVFLHRVRLPALRVLGLHLDIASQVGGDKVDYGKGLLRCKIFWNALHDVQLSGPSAGPTTLFILCRLFADDGPAVKTQCHLSRC